jgi:signal peptidase I
LVVPDRTGLAPRLARLAEVATTVATVAIVAALGVATKSGQWPIVAATGVALLGGGAAIAADLVCSRRGARDARVTTLDDSSVQVTGSVTTVLRVGDEPIEVLRTSILLATQAGPCALIVSGRNTVPESLQGLGAATYAGATDSDAIAAAVAVAGTDAILLLAGRAAPLMASCEVAAGRLDDTHGWVVGTTEPFGSDRYAPDARTRVGRRLRSRAQSVGLDLWEPNATLVRTSLLRAHPLTSGAPRGAWLRERRCEGTSGLIVDDALALVASPPGASTFWPDAMARQRGNTADLSEAITASGTSPRLLATLLLVRELYAIVLLGWLPLVVSVATTGRLPVGFAAGWCSVVLAILIATRWICLRVALDTPRHPVADIRAALYYFPGSLAALPSAVSRGVRPAKRRISNRPLVWAALLLTVLSGARLANRDPSAPISPLAAGTALATLLALWLFAIRALIQRNWERITFRLPLSLPARVDGIDARTFDCSPDGVGVVGDFTALTAADGSSVDVEVDLDDGGVVSTRAVLVGRRQSGAHDQLGLSLQLPDGARAPWVAQLLRAATMPLPHDTFARAQGLETTIETRSIRLRREVDRIVLGLVAIASVIVLGALGLVLVGYRPAVVRSASMTPAMQVGDVIFSESIPIARLTPGDVITRPAGANGSESLTHRLQAVSISGDIAVLRTRGDANATGESWTAPADSAIDRVRWTLPRVGSIVSGVRTDRVQLAIAAGALALVLMAVLGPLHRSLRRAPETGATSGHS